MLFVIGVVILLMNGSLIKFSARNEIIVKNYIFISPIIFFDINDLYIENSIIGYLHESFFYTWL